MHYLSPTVYAYCLGCGHVVNRGQKNLGGILYVCSNCSYFPVDNNNNSGKSNNNNDINNNNNNNNNNENKNNKLLQSYIPQISPT